jgi:hypothetical protein
LRSSGGTNPIGRFGGSGDVISSRSASNTVKYDYPAHSLHVEFTPDASHIELITLLKPGQRGG